MLSAYDGEQALEIATGEDGPDLVLLDLILPRLDGFAVLEAIRAHDRVQSTPVVLLTGCTPSPAYQQRAATLGAAAAAHEAAAAGQALGNRLGEHHEGRRQRGLGCGGPLRFAGRSAVSLAAASSPRSARHRRAASDPRPTPQVDRVPRWLSGGRALESRERVPRQLPGSHAAHQPFFRRRVAAPHDRRASAGRGPRGHGGAARGRGPRGSPRAGRGQALRDLLLEVGILPLRDRWAPAARERVAARPKPRESRDGRRAYPASDRTHRRLHSLQREGAPGAGRESLLPLPGNRPGSLTPTPAQHVGRRPSAGFGSARPRSRCVANSTR